MGELAKRTTQSRQYDASSSSLNKSRQDRPVTLLGDAGNNTISYLGKDKCEGVECIAINTDMQLVEAGRTSDYGTLIDITNEEETIVKEASSIEEVVAEMMHDSALVSWGARLNPCLPGLLRITLLMTNLQFSSSFNESGASGPALYNMDPESVSEVHLGIDLGLYQLENLG